MKSIFLAGGLSGFVLAGAAGLWSGHHPDRILFDASVGALVGGMLFRWLWSVFLRGLRETYLANQRAAKTSRN